MKLPLQEGFTPERQLTAVATSRGTRPTHCLLYADGSSSLGKPPRPDCLGNPSTALPPPVRANGRSPLLTPAITLVLLLMAFYQLPITNYQ